MILVQRYPTALLETLGAKSGGQTPIQTADDLALVMDTGEFYAQALAEVVAQTVAVAATGFFSGGASLVVPAGQVWRARSLSLFSQALGAGQTLDIVPAALFANNQIIVGPAGSRGTVGLICAVGMPFTTPRLFGPGWTFGVQCRELVAGPVNVTVSLDFDRLR